MNNIDYHPSTACITQSVIPLASKHLVAIISPFPVSNRRGEGRDDRKSYIVIMEKMRMNSDSIDFSI